jgi:3-keto-disaccharide hydrolase
MKTWRSLLVLFLVALSTMAHSQSGEWKELFDGKDLVGWKHVGPGEMTVQDGVIKTSGGMGLLYWAGGQLGDCIIRVVFKMEHENDNSGVYIRIPLEPREAWMPVHYGYEIQIDNKPDDYHSTGVVYSFSKAMARPGKPGPEWNTMEITLDGPHTRVTVNGVQVTDFTEGQPVPPNSPEEDLKENGSPKRGPRPNNGYIGLQNHSDKDIVYFKEVAVRMLKK